MDIPNSKGRGKYKLAKKQKYSAKDRKPKNKGNYESYSYNHSSHSGESDDEIYASNTRKIQENLNSAKEEIDALKTEYVKLRKGKKSPQPLEKNSKRSHSAPKGIKMSRKVSKFDISIENFSPIYPNSPLDDPAWDLSLSPVSYEEMFIKWPDLQSEQKYLRSWALSKSDVNGKTPMILAAQHGDVESMRCFLRDMNHDLSLEAIDSDSMTALQWAFRGNHTEIAELLIKYGADINAYGRDGNAPIHMCFLNPTVFGVLLSSILDSGDCEIDLQTHKHGNTALYLAVWNEDVESVRLLLMRGAQVNLSNEEGLTPLMLAAEQGHVTIVELLLDYGARINSRCKHGESALHKAVRKDREKVADILVQKSADLHLKNDNGEIALDICSSPRLCKLLEDYDPCSKSWKWIIDPTDLVEFKTEILGSVEPRTAKAKVYKGYLHGTPVAIKDLGDSEEQLEMFNYEVGLMSDIRHPNILCFLGACKTAEGKHLIVTEYEEGGSLDAFIRKQGLLPWPSILKCLTTTARGMAWLHSRKPIILHRDLHSGNILVTETGECKVADFGISQVQHGHRANRSMSSRLLPPEVARRTHGYTKKSDVFMFGLIMHELLSKQKFTWDMMTDAEYDRLIKQYGGDYRRIRDYVYLMKLCCFPDNPEKRPKFEVIISEFLDRWAGEILVEPAGIDVPELEEIEGKYESDDDDMLL